MNLYALGPLVAGNFHRNRYSGAVTDKFICQASRWAKYKFDTIKFSNQNEFVYAEQKGSKFAL